MKVSFKIHYDTQFGQQLAVSGSIAVLGKGKETDALKMSHLGGGVWIAEIDLSKSRAKSFEYNYLLVDEGNGITYKEAGAPRVVEINKKLKKVVLVDAWNPYHEIENAYDTAAFDVIFKSNAPTVKAPRKSSKDTNYTFEVNVPRIHQDYVVKVVGTTKELGEWDIAKALPMQYDADRRLWTITTPIKASHHKLKYKYVLVNVKDKKAAPELEGGFDHMFDINENDPSIAVKFSDHRFTYDKHNWKGMGVALPVFSLRTENGLGVGEFLDIKGLVDWSVETGMRLVQILPVNDTMATYTWIDSYPYASVSVYALHPMYVNLEAIGDLKDKKKMTKLKKLKKTLNALDTVDYEAVMDAKMDFLKEIWSEKKASFFKSAKVKAFIKEQEEWLLPYAAFCYLRDKYRTPDFSKFEDFAKFDAKKVAKLFDAKSKVKDDVNFYVFVQYHLHAQLLEASEYAQSKGVVLKGDIPIGIYRFSADAWTAPHLYNMNGQAGAPPDDFAVNGQNWGFPTYDWDTMKKDGYAWWTSRMTHLSQYFQTFRIDHILGFFRIWEIPIDSVQGLLGQFRPALPLHINELENRGVSFNHDRFCKPYIREHFLGEMFGEDTDWVRSEFLEHKWDSAYNFKAAFDSQLKLQKHFDGLMAKKGADKERLERVRDGLYSLHNEVLLIPALGYEDGMHYAPRVTMDKSRTFAELTPAQQYHFYELYVDYFFKRQEELWAAQAMEKLPAIKEATNMLICGEDLGMVPDCVPGVMKELEILSLEIQRMPKDPSISFGHPGNYPYDSVASPSSHDMSTVRGWWKEDRGDTQRFYNEILGNWGEAPEDCEPWIAEQVLQQHLYADSIWCIFPLQDLLAIDGEVRRDDAEAERINVPAIKHHYWRYRMHLSCEELVKLKSFNNKLKGLVTASGRNTAY
ncbi:4-alpha-glucanotransferase [Flammeovirga yaeyamensis]|uniref:4-alpha-glucanotransferase n=1 Tax=Flammeovirga yaeyamensis TaxID=367791 RepID=A0AAX1N328_9BACT|nr:4-alpha-glucanotransferase [Flammeovirga yaeyamensis]MBB3696166.1 4-alpha-glucanotransferase [Flammeovirga yaeyamensis]NMF34849.1 4-alpha-glucanotransferase [Flammeovirga yaeyamensis]QWG00323.1 4-alpha-glucanotransferase [Flammeovirga yaeyamensis]